jgi:hypothetical protein
MTTISVQSTRQATAPRGASWAANLFSALTRKLAVSSLAKAKRSQQATRQQEASAVREYAQRFAKHDPRFAADLLAAADRHEIT